MTIGKWIQRSLVLATAVGTSAVLGATVALFLPSSMSLNAEEPLREISVLDLWRKGVHYGISRPINILIMGLDDPMDEGEDPMAGRSDTMLLVRLDPTDHTISILSIPRDTQVEMPGYGVTKINHANAMGGARMAADVIRANFNNIEIDRYVRVNTEAFRQLVDLVGGVEVLVPHDMQYTDLTQGLEIDLRQGLQVLNGDQAEQFVRFRNDGYGDIGRVQRQQQLIRALRDRLTSPSFLPRVPQAIDLLDDYIDTNLTVEEILSLVDFGLDLESDNFRMVMLPGRFSQPEEFLASYWLMDFSERDLVLANYFDVRSPNMARTPRMTSVRDLRIAVQNASGEPQIATQVLNYLYDQGFDDVYVVQDWPTRQAQTQIIVQRGDYQGATSLGTVLGMGKVVAASTGDLESDLTIRVGADWLDRLPQTQADSWR
jgi:LCP family protein required for cell wall assembly